MAHQSNSAQVSAGSLFNRFNMGYGVIESTKLDAWRQFMGDCYGMHVENVDSSSLVCRIDERACRFLVTKGSAEDFVTLGLEIDSEESLQLALRRLRAKGVNVDLRSGEEATVRGVARFWRFRGPKDMTIELYHEPLPARSPLKLGCSGFVTGDQGFGHMALVTRLPERTQAFWEQVFDARKSDEVHQTIAGVPLDFTFLRFNARHHSIALASTPKIRLDPFRTRPQHVEVQVATLDDMSAAYLRCRERKIPISMGVGQHPNDRAVSFYAKTPCGFTWECGWNPAPVDEATWNALVYDRISIWGHHPEDHTWVDNVAQLLKGVGSLFWRQEYVPG